MKNLEVFKEKRKYDIIFGKFWIKKPQRILKEKIQYPKWVKKILCMENKFQKRQ